ncbi:urea ABC transporter ATP-binding protein UrtD [Selenomonas caprae]|uniref:Urea ABC transporter ATP-binding protein UrtD n=1 Tax=Selenomonas caprae TaxID=2606905 RepID=A0A5D6WFP6_9FIRM|nr:urea ABC transporter ATP-binding protein UrtD [Selenomonas caprae]TYZ26846.1 urea ABC transporter ATP-binding protein UrtD [Selenomonas caprae]
MSRLEKKEDLLLLKHISVEFDGFKAIDDVTTSVAPHEIHFFIGPNGAGKTTLLDVICGKTKPSAGEVDYAGVGNILKLKEFEIVKKGICRKFQVPSTFVNLSVYDNMRIAINHDKSVFGSLMMRKRYLDTRKIFEVLHLVGLDKKSKETAKNLSHGEKQWLEIAMLLVEEPRLLLLDEPVAGMGQAETEKTARILEDIKDRCSVAVVEHDMDFVHSIADCVTVMHEGAVLTEGTSEEVLQDERVKEVYLGRGRDEDA